VRSNRQERKMGDYGDWLDHGGGGGDPDEIWPLIDDDEEEGPQC